MAGMGLGLRATDNQKLFRDGLTQRWFWPLVAKQNKTKRILPATKIKANCLAFFINTKISSNDQKKNAHK